MPRPTDPAIKAAALADVAAGMTVKQAALRHGVGESTASLWTKSVRREAWRKRRQESADVLTGGRWTYCPQRHVQVWVAGGVA